MLISQFVLDRIGDIRIDLRERLIGHYLAVPLPKRPFPPRPDPCLTCPPPDFFEAAILGGSVLAATSALRSGGGIETSVRRLQDLRADDFEKQLLDGAAAGLKQQQRLYLRSFERAKELLQ